MPAFRDRVVQGLQRTQKLLKQVDQVTSLLVQAQALRGPALLGLGVRGVSLLLDNVRPPVTPKPAMEWPRCRLPGPVGRCLANLCAPFEVDGKEFGFHENVETNWVFYKIAGQGVASRDESASGTAICVQHCSKSFLMAMRELAWMSNGPKIALVPSGDFGFELNSFVSKTPMTSEKSQAIWDRLLPFLEAGDPRAVLLDGRPGTGKTVLAEDLARRTSEVLGECRTLHILMNELSLNGDSLLHILQLLRPQVVIINDFDRGYAASSLLDFLEACRSWIRLLIVSVNNLHFLSSAVIRPGRFDEIFVVDGLGASFVQNYLSEAHWARLDEEDQELVKAWPVSYLQELKLRLTRYPLAPAKPEVADLENRLAPRSVPDWAERVARR